MELEIGSNKVPRFSCSAHKINIAVRRAIEENEYLLKKEIEKIVNETIKSNVTNSTSNFTSNRSSNMNSFYYKNIDK